MARIDKTKRRRTSVAALAVVPSTEASPSWGPAERSGFVVEVLGGPRSAARVLGVAPSQTSRWMSGASSPGPAMARIVLDVDHVLATALQVWGDADVARDWLTTANAHLDGGRPIDVLRVRGSAEVVDALRAEASGAYA